MALKFKLSSQLQRDGLLVLSQCVKKGKTVLEGLRENSKKIYKLGNAMTK